MSIQSSVTAGSSGTRLRPSSMTPKNAKPSFPHALARPDCTHTAAMSVLAKMDSGFGTERRNAAFGSTAARLTKAYEMQMEVLRRQRTGGHQFFRVEHVHINDGGRAAIGNVKKSDTQG
jgi:hypothetical protein